MLEKLRFLSLIVKGFLRYGNVMYWSIEETSRMTRSMVKGSKQSFAENWRSKLSVAVFIQSLTIDLLDKCLLYKIVLFGRVLYNRPSFGFHCLFSIRSFSDPVGLLFTFSPLKVEPSFN